MSPLAIGCPRDRNKDTMWKGTCVQAPPDDIRIQGCLAETKTGKTWQHEQPCLDSPVEI